MGHVQENDALIDFIDESNLAQFISLSRGESENAHFNVNFCHYFLDCNHINGCLADNQFEPSFGHPYDHLNIPPTTTFPDQHSHFNQLLNNRELLKEAQEDAREYSSGTMTTTSMPTKRSRKGDRSRTLIQEQRRRSRMKEKLYALRALVPNITKVCA